MRKWSIAVLAVSIVIFAGAGVLLSDTDKPDGLPNIAGDWTGKVKVKGFDMTGQGEHEKEKVPVTIEFQQKGSALYAEIMPVGGASFEMEGSIGDGHFWLTTEQFGGVMLWVGHVKNKGKKIVGKFLSGEDTYVFEMSTALKRVK